GQVLERAATENPKMWTDRCDAVGAGDIDLDQLAAVGVAGPSFDLGGFARQRIGHVDGARGRVGDAVAARAEPGNHELLHHGLSIASDRRCVQTDDSGRMNRRLGSQLRSAAMKNSRLPSLPVMGEGTISATRQPCERTKAAISSQTAA